MCPLLKSSIFAKKRSVFLPKCKFWYISFKVLEKISKKSAGVHLLLFCNHVSENEFTFVQIIVLPTLTLKKIGPKETMALNV